MRVTIFRIVPDGLLRPSSVQEYKNDQRGWLRARIEILGGEHKPVGTVKQEYRYEGNLPSCCVSFKFTAPLTVHKGRSILTFKLASANSRIKCEPLDPTGKLTQSDLQFMVKELGPLASRQQVDELMKSYPVHKSIVKNYQVYKDCEMEFQCDVFRYPYEEKILRVMPKQRQRIRTLEPKMFQAAYELLMTQPWLMCFEKHCKPVGLKEMDYDGLNVHRAMEKKPINPFMTCAVRIYVYVKELRSRGHTVFDTDQIIQGYLGHPKWRVVSAKCGDTMERITEALNFLRYHAFTEYVPGVLCFIKDKKYCDDIMKSLRSLKTINPSIQTREGLPVPCKPSNDLTDAQKAFVEHVHHNRITMLVGGPGTGKSECLVALMSIYRRPLVVTYIGMMVDALQRRFGNRVETVHTIHSIYYSSKHYRMWLGGFDLIIVDEFSNVDEHLLGKLLTSVSNFTRLVCVGDLGQIFPIKPGCPFKVMIDHMPQHVFRLEENKRVDKNSRDLAEAARLIAMEKVQDLPFTPEGPLKLIQNHSDQMVEDVVRAHAFQDIMKFQAVVLRNADRKHLNSVIEAVLIKYNIIRPGRMVINIYGAEGKMDLFVGKKIAFTRNVKPCTLGKQEYDGVRNGELARVSFIKPITRNSWELTMESGKVVLVDNSKPASAVQTFDICAGYATTCNKAQGSEWLHILFYIYRNPVRFFTREYAYVAVSRAKKTCTVIGHFDDLVYLCAEQSPPRNTLLERMLPNVEFDPVHQYPYNVDEMLQYVQNAPILPPDTPAVPEKPAKPDYAHENANKKIKINSEYF